MPKLPRLIIEAVDLDIVRSVFSRGDTLVIVEGRLMNSYDELVELCSKQPHKDKDVITIQLVHVVTGG